MMKMSKCCNGEIIEDNTCYVCGEIAEIAYEVEDIRDSDYEYDCDACGKDLTENDIGYKTWDDKGEHVICKDCNCE